MPTAVCVTTGLRPGQRDEDADGRALRDILGADVDHELVDFAAGAGGNPRLLAELALGLVEEGLASEEGGTVHLIARRTPRRVLEFVMNQLGGLSANCQQFLKVAAALGRSFMLEDVSRMLDRSSATLLTPLDEAIASGFVVVAEHQLAFQGDFVFQGVVESIPAPAHDALRREAMRLTEGRIREQLRVTERPTDPYGVARQEPGGSCSRAHSLIMDGDAAAGVRVAERVLASPDASVSARRDAEASIILGNFLLGREEAGRVSERILRERGVEPGDVPAVMALTVRSNVLWRAGKLAEGLSLGRTAVRNSENVDPVWRLHFQLALAGKLANLREFDEAEPLIDDAEAGLRGLPAPVWTAAPAAMRSRLLLQAGRIGEARREAGLATAAAGRDAVPLLRPLAYSVLSTASFYLGDLSAAIDHLHRAQSEMASQVVLDSAQYAWTETLITVKKEGPRAAARLLSHRYSHLPTQRSLYLEDPSAAAFLVRLARDVGDSDLERSVLETVEGLAGDNPGMSVIGLTAMHAKALANSAPAALALIIVQSPDPISVALATEELAKLYAAKAPVGGRQTASTYSEEVDPQTAACWSVLSDMERRIAYLVSVGLTNRQIAKQVHLSAHTVNYHLRKVYRKLGINTRVELAHGAASYSSRAAIYSMGDEER
ncbi:helix-turn-helix transcriptional regulator [Micromonospora sagamiensis]|uniref:helix-turn-helix transcriptional regulator n=1 Tax=Micromonospora sagamiensis TaxID=47875 RepID=UPI0035EF8259